jgi:alpha-glucoside transport system substrate-binding protein
MDMETMRANYGATLDDATYDGNVYGFFFKMAVKSLVWYNPQALYATGYAVPDSWNELMYLSEQLAATGVTPWAIGLESGEASGWPGTDWIEDIMLRTAGPEVYDQWVAHEIPWTDPAVKQAFEIFGKFMDYTYGGSTGVLSINFGDSPAVLFTDPPGAYLHRQADFITAFFPEGLTPGVNYDFFPFPAINPRFGTPVLAAGDLIVAFNDRAAVQELLNYLASAEAQAIWAARGGYITANQVLSLDVYPDELTRRMAEMLVTADVVRFDGSDLMPAAVGAGAFWTGVLDYISGENLDQVLEYIEQAAQQAY